MLVDGWVGLDKFHANGHHKPYLQPRAFYPPFSAKCADCDGALLPVSLALGTGSIPLGWLKHWHMGQKDACCCMGRVFLSVGLTVEWCFTREDDGYFVIQTYLVDTWKGECIHPTAFYPRMTENVVCHFPTSL